MSYLPYERRIDNAIFLLEKAISEKKTLPKICVEYGRNKNYVKDYINKKSEDQLEREVITPEEHEKLRTLHEDYKEELPEIKRQEIKKEEGMDDVGDIPSLMEDAPPREDIEYDPYKDEKFDEDLTIGEPVRESDEKITIEHDFGFGVSKGVEVNRISKYRYHISLRDEEDLVGELTREEMEMIYKLYSNIEGAGITQKSLSRYFNNLTLRDLKRLLRAFKITKQSAPVPPHVIEEYSHEKVIELINQNKEDRILKKLEEDRLKKTEAKLREKEKEVIDLKTKLNDRNEIINNIDIDPEEMERFRLNSNYVGDKKALVLYLSDQHVGAKTEEDSIYNNDYGAHEFNRRMQETLQRIYDESQYYARFEHLIICNLGDCLDGYDEETTRGGHQLSQNMGNGEQFTTYVNGMLEFFDKLHTNDIASKISYYSVGNDNHSGSFGYVANKTLEYIFSERYPDMHVEVFEKFIDHFNYGDHAIVLSHGKDKEYMKGGFPLTLDHKTENYFNDYITQNQILKPYISVVMGDLHQTSVQYAKRFRYKRILSMYGGSKFVHTNFGSTKAGVEYDIIEPHNNNIRSGIIQF